MPVDSHLLPKHPELWILYQDQYTRDGGCFFRIQEQPNKKSPDLFFHLHMFSRENHKQITSKSLSDAIFITLIQIFLLIGI